MTTCDVLLAHRCPLNSSFSFSLIREFSSLLSFPSSSSLRLPSSLSSSLPVSFSNLVLLERVSFHPLSVALVLSVASLAFSFFALLFSRSSSRQGGNRERKGKNGIRRISASIKQELRDRPRRIPVRTICIYLGESYKSRLLSTAPSRSRRYVLRRGVRKVSSRVSPPFVSRFARANSPALARVTEERASEREVKKEISLTWKCDASLGNSSVPCVSCGRAINTSNDCCGISRCRNTPGLLILRRSSPREAMKGALVSVCCCT